MTNKENKKNDDIQNKPSEDAKIIGKKSGDTIDKMAEGAKKASQKAEVAFDNIKEGTKKAGEKAEVVFENVAEGAKKAGGKASEVVGNIMTGMKKVGDKATDAVEVFEIKREISQLENANEKIAPQIGNAVLALYMEKKIKDPTLVAFCKEIEKNNKMIEDKKAQIETIKESETE